MLTLFSCPKPFTNPHNRQIQRNAIGSWLQLKPRPEILLLGDEEGTAQVALEFGVRHIPELARNDYGTPLVSSIFKQAEKAASHHLLCYVNADIILLNDFMEAVNRVARRMCRFLMAGQRWDLDITEPLDFSCLYWERDLRQMVAERGILHDAAGIDYFLFPCDFWGEILPFALGRSAWDNWLIYRARARGAAVIDATHAITAVHQNHDYAHIPGGEALVWTGPEAIQNMELAEKGIFTLLDANWLLTPHGFVRARTARHLRRALNSLPVLHSGWSVPFKLIRKPLSIAKRISAALIKLAWLRVR